MGDMGTIPSTPAPMGEDRIRHIVGVARRAMRVGNLMGRTSVEEQQRLFLLGWLHDIGYEFSVSGAEHGIVGGEMLRQAGYRDWQVVADHGVLAPSKSSTELDILNVADMLTDGHGRAVTFEERLEDIAERHGGDSKVYADCVRLIQHLVEKGYRFASDDVMDERYAEDMRG